MVYREVDKFRKDYMLSYTSLLGHFRDIIRVMVDF